MKDQILSPAIRRYALAGAQARLVEMSQEADAIRRAFPELRDRSGNSRRSNGAAAGQSPANSDDESPTAAKLQGGRGTMSAAQRKAVGERMKKYWAARRRGNRAAAATPDSQTTGKASKATGGAPKRRPRVMSPEARTRISDAQKARWAKQRGAEGGTTESSGASAKTAKRGTAKRTKRGAVKGVRKMSAAARRRMSEAQRKRWAKQRTSE